MMKRLRSVALIAIGCWAATSAAVQASEYIRGLGATGDPRVIARIVTDLGRLWPREMGRYCLNYRDLLDGMLTSDSHKSNLQVVEATVNPLLAKDEAESSEDSEEFVLIQGMAIRLLLETARHPGVPPADRLRIADRCINWLERWRKQIRPEYEKLVVINYDVLIGGTDAGAQEARARLEADKRISHQNGLLMGRQSELRHQIQLGVLPLEQLLRETGRQYPETLEIARTQGERAGALEVGLREGRSPKS